MSISDNPLLFLSLSFGMIISGMVYVYVYAHKKKKIIDELDDCMSKNIATLIRSSRQTRELNKQLRKELEK